MTRQEFRRKYDFLRYRPQTQEYRKSKRELYERANDPALLKFAFPVSAQHLENMRKWNGVPR